MSYYCNFFIGFLFLCSFIQDYLELTQAIMIPILLYIVAKARLRALSEEGSEPALATVPAEAPRWDGYSPRHARARLERM